MVQRFSLWVASTCVIALQTVSATSHHHDAATFDLLNAINVLQYAEITVFLGLFGLLLAIAKCHSEWIHHDDLRWHYFVFFTMFSMNFVSNALILPLRIFQLESIALGLVSTAILFCIRLTFDVFISMKSKSVWTKPAFMTKVKLIC